MSIPTGIRPRVHEGPQPQPSSSVRRDRPANDIASYNHTAMAKCLRVARLYRNLKIAHSLSLVSDDIDRIARPLSSFLQEETEHTAFYTLSKYASLAHSKRFFAKLNNTLYDLIKVDQSMNFRDREMLNVIARRDADYTLSSINLNLEKMERSIHLLSELQKFLSIVQQAPTNGQLVRFLRINAMTNPKLTQNLLRNAFANQDPIRFAVYTADNCLGYAARKFSIVMYALSRLHYVEVHTE